MRRSILSLLLALTLFGTGASSATQSPDAAARIKAEIERLRQSLKDHPIGGDQESLAAASEAALNASAEAIEAGRLYQSLEGLGRAIEYIRAARYAAAKGKTAAQGLPAFEAEWEEASRALTALDRSARERSWGRSPAAARALSEVAEGRVFPLLEGARGFAVATGPADGFVYIGQAQGLAEFAAFCASLDFHQKKARFPLRSQLPELRRLQDKAAAAFQPPRSIELHDRFIALNSSLKFGLELDGAQSYAGSTLQYLEAVRHYGMLEAPTLDASEQSKLQQDLAAARARIEASARDESLARIFLERAASQIGHADGSDPTADEWRSARVILDQVLPAYFAARLPATAGASSAAKTIRMTLVRWPYT